MGVILVSYLLCVYFDKTPIYQYKKKIPTNMLSKANQHLENNNESDIENEMICSICLHSVIFILGERSVNREYLETPCGHPFHEACLSNWLKQH